MAEIRLPAEKKFEKELRALSESDAATHRARPPGWLMSPRAVETYVMGSEEPIGGVSITPKYMGRS